MRNQMINVTPKAYAALLASVARTVLAQDAAPIRADDILPLLRGAWFRQRPEVERALARRLRGRMATDQDPETMAKKLVDMISGDPDEPYDEEEAGNDYDLSPDNEENAASLRRKNSNNNNNGNGKSNGDIIGQILAAVAPHLTEDDHSKFEQFLHNLLIDRLSQDQPPKFGGQPIPGGGMVPMGAQSRVNPPQGGSHVSQALGQETDRPTVAASASDRRREAKIAQDARVVRYASKVRSEQQASFNSRFPEAARLKGGEPARPYLDGSPVRDPAQLQRDRRAANAPVPAMDSTSDLSSPRGEALAHASRIRVL